MGNRCNNCEWWDAPGKRETGYCLKQKPGQRVTQKDFCCPHFSEGLWQDRWNPESIARRAKSVTSYDDIEIEELELQGGQQPPTDKSNLGGNKT